MSMGEFSYLNPLLHACITRLLLPMELIKNSNFTIKSHMVTLRLGIVGDIWCEASKLPGAIQVW